MTPERFKKLRLLNKNLGQGEDLRRDKIQVNKPEFQKKIVEFDDRIMSIISEQQSSSSSSSESAAGVYREESIPRRKSKLQN